MELTFQQQMTQHRITWMRKQGHTEQEIEHAELIRALQREHPHDDIPDFVKLILARAKR